MEKLNEKQRAAAARKEEVEYISSSGGKVMNL